MRKAGSKTAGTNWTDAEKLAVWKKGIAVPGYDDTKLRKDVCGAWMEFVKYGETVEGGMGWEIDHIKPVASGGSDENSNLQPLQWQNNRGKGDNWPNWSCSIKAK